MAIINKNNNNYSTSNCKQKYDVTILSTKLTDEIKNKFITSMYDIGMDTDMNIDIDSIQKDIQYIVQKIIENDLPHNIITYTEAFQWVMNNFEKLSKKYDDS